MNDHYILTNGIVTDGFSFLDDNLWVEISDGKINKIAAATEFSDSTAEKIDRLRDLIHRMQT